MPLRTCDFNLCSTNICCITVREMCMFKQLGMHYYVVEEGGHFFSITFLADGKSFFCLIYFLHFWMADVSFVSPNPFSCSSPLQRNAHPP